MQSFASRTRTAYPESERMRAAFSPDQPAPMMTASYISSLISGAVSGGTGADVVGFEVVGLELVGLEEVLVGLEEVGLDVIGLEEEGFDVGLEVFGLADGEDVGSTFQFKLVHPDRSRFMIGALVGSDEVGSFVGLSDEGPGVGF